MVRRAIVCKAAVSIDKGVSRIVSSWISCVGVLASWVTGNDLSKDGMSGSLENTYSANKFLANNRLYYSWTPLNESVYNNLGIRVHMSSQTKTSLRFIQGHSLLFIV